MSRLGKKTIQVPKPVEVKVSSGEVHVKGPKGELCQSHGDDIEVVWDEKARTVTVAAKSEERETKAKHGLYRALIQNMVTGVSQGYEKGLVIEGVGYKVAQNKSRLVFSIGYCHPIEYLVPVEVKATLDGGTKIKLESHDKRLLGQVAAELRGIRPVEPYKGKGIRYSDEVVRRKVGKAMAK